MPSANEEQTTFTIGKVAERTGVNIETIRYYERRGLLPEPPRTESGYRLYDEESVIRLRFIRQAQELGFSLEEIGELLMLRMDAETSCDEVRRRAERKTAEITEKICALQEMRAALEEMIGACERGGQAVECAFLTILEQKARQ